MGGAVTFPAGRTAWTNRDALALKGRKRVAGGGAQRSPRKACAPKTL